MLMVWGNSTIRLPLSPGHLCGQVDGLFSRGRGNNGRNVMSKTEHVPPLGQ